MKIAVIGGGTSGFLACVHLTKRYPEFDLFHIYDPAIGSIGVGEGTTPDFQDWLATMTGTDITALQSSCQMTRKYGIRFENWGRSHPEFMHNFYPVGEQYAYHLSAARLTKFLRPHIKATTISKNVMAVENSWEKARLTFADGESLDVDFVFDGRGFPRQPNADEIIELGLVPTNSAIIRSAPPVSFTRATRSVARPHGWIFIIPLTHRTSYGYIFNKNLSTEEEVTSDFDAFFAAEKIDQLDNKSEKRLTFPSFVQRQFMAGSVFKIGNTASFVEPLEATSISFILTQIKIACRWPLQRWAVTGRKGPENRHNLEVTNRFLRNYLRRMAYFIGWHYAQGSIFDTPFWNFAQENFSVQSALPENRDLVDPFNQFIAASARFPNPLRDADRFANMINDTFSAIAAAEQVGMQTGKSSAYGLFSELSFAEVGHGLGYPLQPPARSEHLLAAD